MVHKRKEHRLHSVYILRRKFWITFILALPVVFYSEVVQEILGYRAPDFPGSNYLSLVLSSIIFFYGGWMFISSALNEIKKRLPGMMTLISIAILVAYLYSLYVVVRGTGRALFWELSTLIVVMLLGHWMEMKAISGSQGALTALSKLLPNRADVIREGKTINISLQDIKVGDIAIVRPGDKIPADGIIVEGSSEINESIITGESTPIFKNKGDEVIAGSINGDGSLKIKIIKTGKATFLANIMRLVEEAQASKSKLQLLADRAAYYLTLIAVFSGALSFLVWIALRDGAFAVERAVAVLVIACPHALGLAIPLVASISTTRAAQSGFLIKKRLALESARQIEIVLFDKTGTLTKGEFEVSEVFPYNTSRGELISYAASVARLSEHPLSKALVEFARKESISLRESKNLRRIPGKGIRAEVDEKEVMVGSSRLLAEFNLEVPKSLLANIEESVDRGKTLNFVVKDKKVIGAIAMVDSIRQESYEAVNMLRKLGIEVAIITGDSKKVAEWVAKELGVGKYFAEVLPEDKIKKVKELQELGKRVAMVGDGVNDAPALMQADVGIAVGAGTNVALESAGIILVRNDPRDIARIIKLSKLTYNKMIQNLFWATGYNIVALPLAGGVLAFWGIFLQPAVAAIFMSLSTIIVSINAGLLKRVKL